jgi:hypothetical protein
MELANFIGGSRTSGEKIVNYPRRDWIGFYRLCGFAVLIESWRATVILPSFWIIMEVKSSELFNLWSWQFHHRWSMKHRSKRGNEAMHLRIQMKVEKAKNRQYWRLLRLLRLRFWQSIFIRVGEEYRLGIPFYNRSITNMFQTWYGCQKIRCDQAQCNPDVIERWNKCGLLRSTRLNL